jgi:hypothetical protein
MGAALAAAMAVSLLGACSSRAGNDGAPHPSGSPVPTGSDEPSPTPSNQPPTIEPSGPPIEVPSGSKPPQFIVVAFDGSGSHELWNHWRNVAKEAGGTRMTFFLSGIYAVPKDKRMVYHPPGKPQGASDIGWTTAERIPTWIEDVNTAYDEGHEIGTHFNGHFCGPTGVSKWTKADWLSETNQFFDWIMNISTVSGVQGLPAWRFDPKKEIVGGRTPCLEGDIKGALIPALKELGFRYDTSMSGYLRWPQKIDGIWQFPLATMQLAGAGRGVLAMDYNIYYTQTKGQPAPVDQQPALKQQVYDSYWNMFQAAYNGTRAPLFWGNHFERWSGGIYTDALSEVYVKACQMPDVQCVSYRDVANYLDRLDPAALAKLQKLPPQAQTAG